MVGAIILVKKKLFTSRKKSTNYNKHFTPYQKYTIIVHVLFSLNGKIWFFFGGGGGLG